MKSRLLPWPRRTALHLRKNAGALAVVVGIALLFLALDAASGSLSGEGAILVVVLGVPLALSSKGIGVRTGIAALWVQKPVDPVRYYLAGTARDVAVAVGVTCTLLSVLGIVALLAGLDPPVHPVWTICVLSAAPLVVASMASGASMWFPRTGWLLTLGALFFTFYLRVSTSMNPALEDQLWLQLVGAVLPQWESIVSLLDLDALDASTVAKALLRILLYVVTWIGVGVLGLRRRLANGSVSRTTHP